MLVVTQIGWDGSVQRGAFNTAGRQDTAQWEDLIARALSYTPPYHPVQGSSVYHIQADDQTVMVAERDLIGPLYDLVIAVLRQT